MYVWAPIQLHIAHQYQPRKSTYAFFIIIKPFILISLSPATTKLLPLVTPAKHTPRLRKCLALRIQALRLPLHQLRLIGLLEWNAQTLHAHTRGLHLARLGLFLLPRRQILDFILALLFQTVRDQDDILGIQSRDHLFPLRDHNAVGCERGFGFVVHVALDGLQEGRNLFSDFRNGDGAFLASVSAGEGDD